MTLDILIIDDKPAKIDALRQVISPLFGEGDVLIEESFNIVDARDKMRENAYDLVILDMVIPELEDGEPLHRAGVDFLNEIYDNSTVLKPLEIIGLTEYEAEYTALQEEFKSRLWYLLYYSQSNMEWKRRLKDKVLQLDKMKRNFVENLESRNKYNVGIICANSEEFEQMQNAFEGCLWDDCNLKGLPWHFRNTSVATSSFKDLKVIAACADHTDRCAVSVLASALCTCARIDHLFFLTDSLREGETTAGSVKLKSLATGFASEEGFDIHIVDNSEAVSSVAVIINSALHFTAADAEFLYQFIREKL